MEQELEQKLFDKYPSLFRERTLPSTKSLMRFGCDHGDGWYRIIEEICSRIEAIDTKKQVTFSQIKQKFGILRIYFNFTGDREGLYKEVAKIIGEGESLSGKVCENCGDWGTKRGEGWIKVLCDKCQENRYK